MTDMQVQKQVISDGPESERCDVPKPSSTRISTVDGRDNNIVVAPPHRNDGVAMMLLALGDAGIEICHIEPRVDDNGLYRLTVNDSSDLTVRILEGIGCQVGLWMKGD
jgi:GNAT superfamily N-acetyltransferase